MKILIIDDDEDIRDILAFTVESEISADFIFAESGNSGVAQIKANPDIDLIISDYNMPDGNGGVIYNYLLDEDINIPYTFCSSDDIRDHSEFNNDKFLFSVITKPHLFEGIQEIMTRISELQSKDIFHGDEFTPIDISLLLCCSEIPCEVYLRISESKTLKVLSTGDIFEKKDVEKYENKKIKKLLVSKGDVKHFVDCICQKIVKILEDENEDSGTKVLDIHAVIVDTAKKLGFSDELIKVTNRSVDFAIDTFNENEKFKDIYGPIFENNKSYLTKHSVALAYITNGILAKTPWDSADNRVRLVMASFLHDVSIRNPDYNEFSVDKNDEESVRTFKDHPREAIDLIKNLKGLPQDLDRIILDHHEKPDGSGLPRGLTSSQLSPLSSLFIFCHNLVDALFSALEKSEKLSKNVISSYLNFDDYQAANFKKCSKAYKDLKIFECD